jgi:hypothetical protein
VIRAGPWPLAQERGPAYSSAQQVARGESHGFGKLLDRRDLRIALAALDSRYLGCVHPAPVRDFLLRHPGPQAGTPKIPAEVATHAGDRPCWRRISP